MSQFENFNALIAKFEAIVDEHAAFLAQANADVHNFKSGENIISRYGNAPARYLTKELAVGKHDHVVTKATFISDNIAVITTLAGDKPEGILTCLTVTTPPPFTLTGKTLTIEAIECTGENQPATITFQAN